LGGQKESKGYQRMIEIDGKVWNMVLTMELLSDSASGGAG